MARSRYKRVTGMQDVLPETALYWRYVLNQAQQVMDKFGFQRIDNQHATQCGAWRDRCI